MVLRARGMNSACWQKEHGLVLLGSSWFPRTAGRLGFVMGTPSVVLR